MREADGTASPLEADLTLIATSVQRRGLETPAIFFLELYKPLSQVLQNVVFFSTPIFAPIFGLENMQRAAKILESSESVEQLIQKIERNAA